MRATTVLDRCLSSPSIDDDLIGERVCGDGLAAVTWHGEFAEFRWQVEARGSSRCNRLPNKPRSSLTSPRKGDRAGFASDLQIAWVH